MNIRFAEIKDRELLISYDKHISKEEMRNIIQQSRIILVEDHNQFVGWLRYNLFWDHTPFINMLYILEEYRGKGFGRQVVEFWENEMRPQEASVQVMIRMKSYFQRVIAMRIMKYMREKLSQVNR